ncbi:unnamed protein product [Cuscuta epithymum]|uniref:B box-type domain-containing protein n=1 Tax=Cuscuta epithymum TaxID=186058 RepID=A0AAV0CMB2_9ASTE|nr:unnamed protein product [Cuscuta epithymum]
MKIQCDVCGEDEAAVFCVADEAALCPSCDQTVHNANKLASKHQRFSLLHPPPSQPPLCDICQERKAWLFCEEDRAMLCGECDVPIHKANENTRTHNRFLVTGVQLSPTSSSFSPSSPATSLKSQNYPSKTKHLFVSPAIQNTPPCYEKGCGGYGQMGNATATGSPLLEYLEMLPGYHFEELLDSSYGLFKMGEADMFSLWDTNNESLGSLSSESSVSSWAPTFKRPRISTD